MMARRMVRIPQGRKEAGRADVDPALSLSWAAEPLAKWFGWVAVGGGLIAVSGGVGAGLHWILGTGDGP
jgi:hypothetical protein